ncbi:YisL family protein [Bacillus kexueae]|uniref:YisL family protein n=1 Tax=Aeribacillus kexueae TaxID=2078952 RepID=UPI001FAF7D0E|nr:YisL family protein [Bacillus kexueae]
MTHMHITSWVILLILFFIAYAKNSKGIHMAVRFFYLVVIATGAELIFRFNVFQMEKFVGEYIGKIVLAIVLIGLMEMMLIRKRKGTLSKGIVIGFWIVLVLVILLGFRLPLSV